MDLYAVLVSSAVESRRIIRSNGASNGYRANRPAHPEILERCDAAKERCEIKISRQRVGAGRPHIAPRYSECGSVRCDTGTFRYRCGATRAGWCARCGDRTLEPVPT